MVDVVVDDVAVVGVDVDVVVDVVVVEVVVEVVVDIVVEVVVKLAVVVVVVDVHFVDIVDFDDDKTVDGSVVVGVVV